VLRLYSPKPKRFWEEDIHIARAIASQCAIAITNARLYTKAIEGARMAEQVRLAGIVQRRMIPEKAPQIPGLDIAAAYIPCFDVGGDLYDFLQFENNSLAVVIADVMGKGIPAAIMMSSFRGAMKAYIDTVKDIPTYCAGKNTEECNKNIIKRINRMACEECRDGEFITLFHAAVNARDMTITYCNCGHEPTVLIRDGKIIELDKGGLVLGVDEHAEYEIETVELEKNDCLLFYTDGLIDAMNFDNELWGRDKMLRTAKKYSSGSAEQMINNILGYRRRFVGLAKQLDDMSIIVIKVGG
jgi:sigma-B regulation protein RsbU (phosphoserine phosphatase)